LVSSFDCRALHTVVYCGAVRSTILATAWLLVLIRAKVWDRARSWYGISLSSGRYGCIGRDDCSVRLDATEKVVIRCSEHVRDFQLVDPAVTQPLATSQLRVETCAVSGRTHAGPRRSRVLDARNDDSTEYIL